MNKKRFWWSWLAVFAFIFLFEWVFHGTFLKGWYESTASMWRSESEMMSKSYWMIAGQVWLAGVFCWIFLKGYENKGLWEGVRYGLWVALLMTAPWVIMYSVAPYPGMLTWWWIVGGVVEFVVAGGILASVYKPARR